MIRQFLFFLLVTLAFVFPKESFAQRPRKKSEGQSGKEDFLNKQWWIGLRGGVNITQAVPVAEYSVFSSTDGKQDSYKKVYEKYKPVGAVAGVEITFSYRFLSLSFQPAFKRQNFSYTNSYSWTTDSLKSSLSLKYVQEHKLDYMQFPLFLKCDFLKGTFKPFVQAGAYYSTLVSATKSVTTSGKDEASGGVQFEGVPVRMGAKDLFIKSNVGYAIGLGFNWNPGNVRFILDANYFRGTSNITDRKNRYKNNQLAGSGDALDDIKLRSFAFNLACVFPLRYLLVNKATTSGKKDD